MLMGKFVAIIFRVTSLPVLQIYSTLTTCITRYFLKYNLQFMKHFLHICRELADYMVPTPFCNSATNSDEIPSLLTSCFRGADGNSTRIISPPWEAKRSDSALPTPKYLGECFLLLSPPCKVESTCLHKSIEFLDIILVLIRPDKSLK